MDTRVKRTSPFSGLESGEASLSSGFSWLFEPNPLDLFHSGLFSSPCPYNLIHTLIPLCNSDRDTNNTVYPP